MKKNNTTTSNRILNIVIEDIVKENPGDKIQLLEADLKNATGEIVGIALLMQYDSDVITNRAVELGIEDKTPNIVFRTQYVWGEDVQRKLNKTWGVENMYDAMLLNVLKAGITSSRFNRALLLEMSANKLKQIANGEQPKEQEGETPKMEIV